MPLSPLATVKADAAPLVAAPDGSAVRVLCATERGSTILFALQPGAVSKAVAHRTVEEIWYVVAGGGRMWRKACDHEEITALAPGVSLTIPVGTCFQFRCDSGEPLQAVAVTMPPWPGDGEAYAVTGLWEPTV